MPHPASSSSSSKLSIKTLFWSLFFATTTALLGLVFVRPRLRFNLLPPPPKDEAKKEITQKKKESNKVEGNSSTSSPDVTIKGVEEKEYEDCGAKAVDAFKAGDFTEALNGFTHALALGKDLGGVTAQQKTILSNRSACYEKLGRFSAALDDCASILRSDPKNSKVQKRRERIFGKLLEGEEFQAALTELMVTFLLDMEAYKRQVQWNPSAAQSMQLLPPPNLDEVAKKAARKMILDMEEASGGKMHAPKILPSSYTIKQVLNLLPSFQKLRGTMNTLRQIEQITADLGSSPSPSSSSSSSSSSRRLALLFERALALITAENFKRGDQDLAEALRLVRQDGASLPTNEEQSLLLSWAGTFLHLKHELNEAREVLEESSRLDPTSVEVLIKRGCLHLDRNEMEDAKVLCDKARGIAPTSAFVYLWRCQLWMCGKMTEEGLKEAEKELTACLELDEDNVVALTRLMNIQMQHNNIEAAEKTIEKAKKAAPRNADVVGAYAEFLLMQGRIDEASKELEKATRLDPTNPLPFINKALIAWQGQDTATARETLQHVIQMDPLYQPAYSFLANLEFKGASTADDSRPAFETIDKGMEICRSKDDLEELAQIKVLALAKLEGARRLGLAVGELMG